MRTQSKIVEKTVNDFVKNKIGEAFQHLLYHKLFDILKSLSRDLNTGPADYKSAALPTKPLRRHILYSLKRKKDGALPVLPSRLGIYHHEFYWLCKNEPGSFEIIV